MNRAFASRMMARLILLGFAVSLKIHQRIRNLVYSLYGLICSVQIFGSNKKRHLYRYIGNIERVCVCVCHLWFVVLWWSVSSEKLWLKNTELSYYTTFIVRHKDTLNCVYSILRQSLNIVSKQPTMYRWNVWWNINENTMGWRYYDLIWCYN